MNENPKQLNIRVYPVDGEWESEYHFTSDQANELLHQLQHLHGTLDEPGQGEPDTVGCLITDCKRFLEMCYDIEREDMRKPSHAQD